MRGLTDRERALFLKETMTLGEIRELFAIYVSRRYVHGWDPEWERFFDLARSHEGEALARRATGSKE